VGTVICVTNQKGGVGKTTTCVNLAASLAATQRRVLLVDMDPQANATMGCGIDKNALEYSICDVLLDDVPIADVLQTPPEGGPRPSRVRRRPLTAWRKVASMRARFLLTAMALLALATACGSSSEPDTQVLGERVTASDDVGDGIVPVAPPVSDAP